MLLVVLLEGYDDDQTAATSASTFTSSSHQGSSQTQRPFESGDSGFPADPFENVSGVLIEEPLTQSVRNRSHPHDHEKDDDETDDDEDNLNSSSEDNWNDDDYNLNIFNFTESFQVNEDEDSSLVNLNQNGEGDDDNDGEDETFEDRLLQRQRLSSTSRLDLLNQLEKEREKMLLERKSSSSDLAGAAIVDPDNPDGAAATDNMLTSPNSTATASTNRLSVNFDEMLKDFHSADIKLTESDETSTNKRRQEYIKLFLHADRIFSSPLTRALETAVLSMEGHRAAKASGITLYR
jgi:hypothetical protein